MEQIENHMVVDWHWNGEAKGKASVKKEPDYREIGTQNFVSESDAYEYALEQCLNSSEEDKKVFREMLVEWYFSGNWVKEES